MKIKIISTLAIFILSITAINCDRNVIPFVPEIDTSEQAGKATLVGNLVRIGSNSMDFSSVNIRIRGTNLRVNPDENGNFRIDNFPLGDSLLEIDVKNSLSYIPINDVKSNDEVDVKMEVLANDEVILKEKGKKKKSEKSLYVTINPHKWNTDWEDSSEEVTAQISGRGCDDIEPLSVKMIGPQGDEIMPSGYEQGKNSFQAKFYKKDAITIIPDPKPGESYEIQVTGEFSEGASFELTDTVIIVGKKSEGELFLEIEPHKWNTAWESNEGVVTVRISGEGFDEIVPGSVKMIGPEGDEVSFQSYEVTGNCFMAKFLKKDALSIIPEPISGDIHEIQVVGELSDGTSFELIEVIIIAGKKSEGELSLVINPGKWNTNWEESSDEVTARISGEGFDEIVPGSVKMIGPEGNTITPYTHEVGGNHFMAKFLQKDAIGLIPDPKSGESYEIQVTGTLSDGTFELTDEIEITGKETKELTLKIQPDKWNTNWAESVDAVEARISGEGFDEIVSGSVKMVGPGGDSISPYIYEADEDSFIARFYRKDALGLISDPKPKDSYEIQVTGTFNDGSGFTLKYTISIVGSKK